MEGSLLGADSFTLFVWILVAGGGAALFSGFQAGVESALANVRRVRASVTEMTPPRMCPKLDPTQCTRNPTNH